MNVIYSKNQNSFIFQFEFKNIDIIVKLFSLDDSTHQIKLSIISNERTFGKTINDVQERIIEILSPGEYEYSGIYVSAFEVVNNDKQIHLGYINFLAFSFKDIYFIYAPFVINLKNLTINFKDQNKIVLIVDNNYESEWLKEILRFFKVNSILSNDEKIISKGDLFNQKNIIKSQKIKLNQLFSNTLQIINLISD